MTTFKDRLRDCLVKPSDPNTTTEGFKSVLSKLQDVADVIGESLPEGASVKVVLMRENERHSVYDTIVRPKRATVYLFRLYIPKAGYPVLFDSMGYMPEAGAVECKTEKRLDKELLSLLGQRRFQEQLTLIRLQYEGDQK